MAEAYPTFGSYVLFKELGRDALGHTYRAAEVDRSGAASTVLLRVLDAPQVPADAVVQSFGRARRIAAALKASSAARGARFATHRGVPALACEYVSARPLSTVLERAREEGFPVPVDNALLILEKVALALTAALAMEVDGAPLAHGFLHPGLVLVSTDGEALVMGLGVADALLGMLDHAEVAGALQPYLAPEVLLTKSASRSGDVYSLGAVLVELLTGTPLPADPAARAGFLNGAQLVYDERPLPPDIAAVLARAIAPRPADRFSSAADFRQELERLLYGGAYSPTTFNLALFMDRLFRAEIEAEERERAAEAAVDLSPYLRPEPPRESPVARPLERVPPSPPPRRGLWVGLGIAAAALAGAAVLGYATFADRLSGGPAAPPTPTAEEIAARRQEEEQRLQQMVQSMVQEKMAEREKQLRDELLGRQARIEELQRRLQASERQARERRLSADEQRKRSELEQQIAAAEAAQRESRAALAAEQERRTTQTSPAASATPLLALSEEPTATPRPAPTATVRPAPAAPSSPTRSPVTPGMFVTPSAVDTLPVLLRDSPVNWPRVALYSRGEGVVIIQATVDGDGRVTDVRVLRGDHENLGVPKAVADAVLKYRFKPATKDGVPVTTYATVTKRYVFTGR